VLSHIVLWPWLALSKAALFAAGAARRSAGLALPVALAVGVAVLANRLLNRGRP
jgi:ribose 1,5-bisphosphokinase PhnN